MTSNEFCTFKDNIKQEKEILNNKDDIGVCISGGGIRAAILSCGWIKALKKNIAFNKIKYISLNSGSTWFYLLYLNSQKYNIHFSDILEFKDCTLDNLNNLKENTFEYIISNCNFEKNLIKSLTINELFNLNIENNFWINTVLKSFSLNGKYKEIENTLEIYKINDININDNPFYIFNSSLYNNYDNNYYTIEFTPYKYSIPQKINLNEHDIIGEYSTFPEYFTKNEIISTSLASSLSSNLLDKPILSTNTLLNKLNLTKKWDMLLPSNLNSLNTDIYDGEYIDNTSIISLLRRKISKIISFLCCAYEITDPIFYDKNIYIGNNDITQLFFDINLNTNKYAVFSKETWNELYKIISLKLKNGEPSSALINTVVLNNEF